MAELCTMECMSCGSICYRRGARKGQLRYSCTKYGRWQQSSYKLTKITPEMCEQLIALHINSMGISDISRVLQIGKSTVVKYLRKLAHLMQPKKPLMPNGTYELDEVYTYIGHKKNPCWIAYVIDHETRKPVHWIVGRRTKVNLQKLINQVLLMHPKEIRTDQLNLYRGLIPEELHTSKNRRTNRIERSNLNLRTWLKRLNRKSLCYSKSEEMLWASVELLFGSTLESSPLYFGKL